MEEEMVAMNKIRDSFFRFLAKYSYKKMVITFFMLAAVVPMLLLQFVSYGYLKNSFQKNLDDLSQANVARTRSNVDSVLSAYEDILYQIYTNDDMIAYINNIERDEDLAMNMNRLRNYMRDMCYAKDGIEAVSIITPKEYFIHYDKLTASSVNSSWVDRVGKTRNELYTMGMLDYKTHILPTHFAKKQLDKNNYLFHLMHRVVNYKDTNQSCGVVILSLNEDVLQEICKEDELENSYSYIVDEAGRIISHEDEEKIGMMSSKPLEDTFAEESNGKNATYVSDPVRGWRVVTVYDRGSFWQNLTAQLSGFLGIGVLIILAAFGMILLITTLLSHSMNRVVAAMQQAQKGDLKVSVPREYVVSSEMLSIVDTFNTMMKKIARLLEEVEVNAKRRQDAEITALEAQVNPHFLYNTLDSINWMAIENDQFEISNILTSLAKILRYSINKSNTTVLLRDELEWARQYIYLQSIRFKDKFEYVLEVEEESTLHIPIHKLILQPFIENAIVHGFKGSERKNILKIRVWIREDVLWIAICDNGKGMEQAALDKILDKKDEPGDHIGLANAIGRIRMYYGEKSQVRVETGIGVGTTVTVCINEKRGTE